MKENQIIFYNTTVGEALEMLEMESRRDNALINFEDFEVKLNKKGDSVLVTLVRGLSGMSIAEGIVQLKVDFSGKFRDMESIDRVQAVLALNPNSDWWSAILEELQIGEPLGYRVEEILIETEERIENPDPQIWELVNKAIAEQPTNRFYRSLYDQVVGGRDLSEKQIEALKKGLRHTMSFGHQPSNQLVRIEKALELDPRNRFVLSLKSKSEDGIQLSERQMNVVEEIIASQSSPASKLLADLKSNAYLERSDFMLLNKGQRRGIDSLNDEERKRLRHLIYRNERKLDNSYSREDVRRLLKKGNTMRKLSSRNRMSVFQHYIDPQTNELKNLRQLMTLKELVEELSGLDHTRVEHLAGKVIFVGYGDYSGVEYSYVVKQEELYKLMLEENFKGLL